MKITCPDCYKEIPAADVDLKGKTAKCVHCNNVFSFSHLFPDPDAKPRAPLGKPKNFTIEHSPEGLTIVRRWFSPAVIFMSFFCLFWNTFMVFWFYTAFSQKAYSMALFGSLHGVVGLGLLYATVAGFINKTYVRIAFGTVSVRHKPFPSFGQKHISRQDIKQLYSKETVHHHKHGYSYSYSVQMITTRGAIVELVSGLPSKEEALFLEQEIEKYLGIDDESVRDELPR